MSVKLALYFHRARINDFHSYARIKRSEDKFSLISMNNLVGMGKY